MADKLIPAVAGVLALGLAGTAGFLELQTDDGVDPGMVVVARQQVDNFFSLDHRHVEEDVDKVVALATGRFKEEYVAQRQQVVDGVVANKLVATADIPDGGAAVEFYDGDKARMLISVDVTKSNATAEPSENRYRTRVLLIKVGDEWLVSGLNQVE